MGCAAFANVDDILDVNEHKIVIFLAQLNHIHNKNQINLEIDKDSNDIIFRNEAYEVLQMFITNHLRSYDNICQRDLELWKELISGNFECDQVLFDQIWESYNVKD